jgi:hypothetical protein
MRLRRIRHALGAAAVGLVLSALPAAEVRAALFYDFTLGAGVQRNDNLHLDPESPGDSGAGGEEDPRQPVEVTVYTLNPGALILWTAERDQLQLRYSGEYSAFRGDEEPDPFWAHTLAANLNWRRWSPFFFEAGEERARVPRTQDQDVAAAVDLVDRNRLTARTGLVSEVGARSTIELAYRGELETYSSNESVDPAVGTGAGTDELDEVRRQYGEALVRHRWTPLWESEARVAYGRVDRELASSYAEFLVAADVSQRWSEQLVARYRLEWRREDDYEPGESADAATPPEESVRTNLLLGAEIRGTLERGGSWNLAYQDRAEDQPDGDTLDAGRTSAAIAVRARGGSALDVGGWHELRDYRLSGREETAWGPSLGARWMIVPWAALDVGGSWTKTTIREDGTDEIEDRTSRVSAGIVLMVLGRVQLEAGCAFRKNDSSDALRSYENTIVFAQVTFHFRPVEPGRLPPSAAAGLVGVVTPTGVIAPAAQPGSGTEPAR